MKKLEDYPDVLTTNDLLNIMPISKSSLYKLLKSDVIKHLKVGSKFIIPKQYVIDYLQSSI